ncbi:hypothetical protein DICA2_E26038 [Diutina catenulata]
MDEIIELSDDEYPAKRARFDDDVEIVAETGVVSVGSSPVETGVRPRLGLESFFSSSDDEGESRPDGVGLRDEEGLQDGVVPVRAQIQTHRTQLPVGAGFKDPLGRVDRPVNSVERDSVKPGSVEFDSVDDSVEFDSVKPVSVDDFVERASTPSANPVEEFGSEPIDISEPVDHSERVDSPQPVDPSQPIDVPDSSQPGDMPVRRPVSRFDSSSPEPATAPTTGPPVTLLDPSSPGSPPIVLSGTPSPVAPSQPLGALFDLSSSQPTPSKPAQSHPISSPVASQAARTKSLPSRFDDTDPISSSPAASQGPPKPTIATLAGARLIPNPTPAQMRTANRVSRSKDELVGEMALYMPHAVYDRFNKLDLASVYANAKLETYASDLPLLYWQRSSSCVWDEEQQLFLPTFPYQAVDDTAVLFYEAPEFVDGLDQVARDIGEAKQRHSKIIVMVQELDKHFKKIQNAQDRAFREQVRRRMEGDEVATPPDSADSVKQINRRITAFQLKHQVNLYPVRTNTEACEWLFTLGHTLAANYYTRTAGISDRPRSGRDRKTVFLSAVTQFKMMTDKRAQTLYSCFPSFAQLSQVLTRHGAVGKDVDGKNIVPPTVEQALLKAFTSDDPNASVYD